MSKIHHTHTGDPYSPSTEDIDTLRQRATALGLTLLDDDLRTLAQGWHGLQPLLARLRRGLAVGQRPPITQGQHGS